MLDFGEFLAELLPVLSDGFRNRIVRGLLDRSFRYRRRAGEMTRTDRRHRSWLMRRGRRLLAATRESPEWRRIARSGGGGWEP